MPKRNDGLEQARAVRDLVLDEYTPVTTVVVGAFGHGSNTMLWVVSRKDRRHGVIGPTRPMGDYANELYERAMAKWRK